VPHRLVHGNVIQLGETKLVFRSGSAPAPMAAVTEPVASESAITEETDVKEQPPVPAPAPPLPAPLPEKPVTPTAPLIFALLVRSGDLSGRTFRLNQSPMTVGRNPASDIVIRHETTSWNHAIFKQEDMKWFVKDVGSRNGTRLNDNRLEPNQPYPLQVGDQLKFGDTLLEVIQDAG